jgi:hypothetical protein
MLQNVVTCYAQLQCRVADPWDLHPILRLLARWVGSHNCDLDLRTLHRDTGLAIVHKGGHDTVRVRNE